MTFQLPLRMRYHLYHLVSASLVAFALPLVAAEPVITSPPPASGLSPSSPIVFTFSQPMNTEFTAVDFYDFTTFAELPTIATWSAGDTVLTCTPSPAFPANRQIVWSAYGENLAGEPLGEIPPPGGLFTTGSGSGSGGSGTNAITTFSVGKTHHYNQVSEAAPLLDPETPYGFSGVTSLASNRTATSITLTLPTGAISNLTQIPTQPEIYAVFGVATSEASYDATFPAGDYTFSVSAPASNQTVIVTLPPTSALPQPNAPHVTNFLAAQTVDPGQPFVLGWDAFAGGASAGYIDVDIGTAYGSPNPGMPGALSGTARTFTIPAGTLQPNTTYFSRVGFFFYTGLTNASYVRDTYRATYTEFYLKTSSGSSGLLVLTNAAMAGGVFSFNVLCSTGQTVTVEYTNAVTATTWTKLLTTNSEGSIFHVVSTQSVAHPRLFYRARSGS